MDAKFYLIIAVTLVGFVTLAFVLLYPVYRFLNRQERLADEWTPDAVARRQRRGAVGDGASGAPPAIPEGDVSEPDVPEDQR